MFPDLYQEAIAALPPRNLVVVAVPDHFHYPVIRAALEHDQHVLTVKPLVLKYAQAVEIEELAHEPRAVRRRRVSQAVRPPVAGRPAAVPRAAGSASSAAARPSWSSRTTTATRTSRTGSPRRTATRSPTSAATTSTWSTSSPGCGRSRSRSAASKGKFPNGNVGYLWSAGPGRLGERRDAERAQRPGLSRRRRRHERPGPVHVLRRRRLRRRSSATTTSSAASATATSTASPGAAFRFVSPDYFRLVPWEGDGPEAGRLRLRFDRGHRQAAMRVNAAGAGLAERRGPGQPAAKCSTRSTAAASSPRRPTATINELVIEAARLSIAADGRQCRSRCNRSDSRRMAFPGRRLTPALVPG